MNEHDSLDHPHPDIGRSLAGLASQPKLGLWPKRIAERRSRCPADTVVDGANLGEVISLRRAGTSNAKIAFGDYHR